MGGDATAGIENEARRGVAYTSGGDPGFSGGLLRGKPKGETHGASWGLPGASWGLLGPHITYSVCTRYLTTVGPTLMSTTCSEKSPNLIILAS